MNAEFSDYKDKDIFFSGIGGCSMNGLARILHAKGYKVCGSDRNESNFTEGVKQKGIGVVIGQVAENVENADLMVYSAAIKPENPERKRAFERGIPQLERSELLGQITRMFKQVVGIAGCHGKTTITSMLALILEYAGIESTVHVGGEVAFLEGGTRVGKDDNLFVTEACEYVESFLHISPTIALINNIDDDHLDYFKDIDHIVSAFEKYVALLPEDSGMLLACADDERVAALAQRSGRKYLTYGFSKEAQLTFDNLSFSNMGFPRFDCILDGKKLGHIELSVPGRHNALNALGAIAVALHLGAEFEAIESALSAYTLTKRRFEFYGEVDGVNVFHDYAHHPNEISATLDAADSYPHNRIWCIFQCNSYSRALTLKEKYAQSFSKSDFVIVPEIYPGREVDTGLIHARDLVDAIVAQGNDCVYIRTFEEIRDHLRERWQPNDLVITLGSGDVASQTRKLL